MCLVAVGLYACGHGKVLVSHPATKKCDLAVNGLCVPEHEIPDSDLVSEYILIEGPTYNRMEKGIGDASIRTMCQRPCCDNFRPDIRCVELVVELVRNRIQKFRAGFAQLTQAYQCLEEDIAHRDALEWFTSEKHDEWRHEYSLAKLEEALQNLEAYHDLCIQQRSSMSETWDGLVLNPVESDSSKWPFAMPKYRCFPSRTFNKAACFSRKANDKFDHLHASLQQLQSLQKARNVRRMEELFAEHDEMAGIDRQELELAATRAKLHESLADISVSLFSIETIVNRNDDEISPLTSPVSDDIFFDACSEIAPDTPAISPLTVSFPGVHGLEASADEDDDSQSAKLADLIATSEPLFRFKDVPLMPNAIVTVPATTAPRLGPDDDEELLESLESVVQLLDDISLTITTALAKDAMEAEAEEVQAGEVDCACGAQIRGQTTVQREAEECCCDDKGDDGKDQGVSLIECL